LQHAGLLVLTGGDPPAYLPGRDIGSIALNEALHTVRTAGGERYLGPQSVPAAKEIESIPAQAKLAFEAPAHELTVRNLLTPAARDATGG